MSTNKMNNHKRLKAIVLSLGLGAMLLSAAPVQAQGLFGKLQGYEEQDQAVSGALFGGVNSRDGGSTVGNEAFGAVGSQIGNEPFGAPIGGGIGILLAAGMGYALIQSKKNKQN